MTADANVDPHLQICTNPDSH